MPAPFAMNATQMAMVSYFAMRICSVIFKLVLSEFDCPASLQALIQNSVKSMLLKKKKKNLGRSVLGTGSARTM